MTVWRPASRPSYAGPLLLDTHAWIWMLEPAGGRLPAGFPPMLRRAAAAQSLYVSEMAFWEVAQKAARRKLVLSLPVRTWLGRAAEAPGVTYLSLDRETLVLGAEMVTTVADPADRLHIATAKLIGAPLATADAAIIRWARHEGATGICDLTR